MGSRVGGNLSATSFFVAVVMVISVPLAQAQVGVSVEINQPGVYGRVDIGGLPAPRLIVPRPVVIAPVRGQASTPVYLWVPPEHRTHWARHCHRYAACGAPVYFVRDDWYREHVQHEDKARRRGDAQRADRSYREGDGRERGHQGGHDSGHDDRGRRDGR